MSQRAVERYSISSTSSIDSYDFSHYDKENQLPANLEDYDLNDYENNELVQKTIQDLNKFFATVKCQCATDNKENKKCFEVVGFKRFFERHLQFRALGREELDAVLMGQILAFQCDGNIKKDGHRSRDFFRYRFNGQIALCMTVYLKLVGVGRNKLDAIKRQLEEYGLTMRVHGNIKRLPQRSSKVTITHDNAKEVSSFILNYAEINGLPRPGSHLEKDDQALIYLPTDENYTSVFHKYEQAMKSMNKNNDQISRSSFVRLWKSLTPHIKFMTPKSDLCNVCETLRWKIGHTNRSEDKEELLVEYASHTRIAKLEREYYNDNIKKAKENASHTNINIHSPLASKERPTPNTVDGKSFMMSLQAVLRKVYNSVMFLKYG